MLCNGSNIVTNITVMNSGFCFSVVKPFLKITYDKVLSSPVLSG